MASDIEEVFVDTNVFVAAVTGEEKHGQTARAFLDLDLEFSTSVVNLMEFRTVMTKKKGYELEEVQERLQWITDDVDVYFPEVEDLVTAYEYQVETLLYPLDCIILVTADLADCPLVTFDSELQNDIAVPPESFLK